MYPFQYISSNNHEFHRGMQKNSLNRSLHQIVGEYAINNALHQAPIGSSVKHTKKLANKYLSPVLCEPRHILPSHQNQPFFDPPPIYYNHTAQTKIAHFENLPYKFPAYYAPYQDGKTSG